MKMDDESSRHDNILGSILQDGSSDPQSLPLEFLREITNNFSDEQLLGEGGFGKVYKGVLQNGEMIAVKKFASSIPGVKGRHFENEAHRLMRLKHPNVVLLVGCCFETENIYVQYKGKYICAEKSERLLCLEYMPKGSLRGYLSDESSGLDWNTRYKIIKGICHGIHHLHEEWQLNSPIIHMDLKPANILLDNNMVPKIADFGLSRLFSEEKTWTCTTSRDGTFGYMAPEYINRGLITKKSDIFSFGVILIEIMTGHRDYPNETTTSSYEFVGLILNKWRNRLEKEPGYTSIKIVLEQIRRCIKIGLLCVEHDRLKRPTTNQIMKMLEDEEHVNRMEVKSQMTSSLHVEMEAAKLFHKLILESKDEPVKLATKLYVICQHMRLSGKEQSLPYQVISRAMEIVVSNHGIDVDALQYSRIPFADGPSAGNSSGAMSKDKEVTGNQSPMVGSDASQNSGQSGLWQFPSGKESASGSIGTELDSTAKVSSQPGFPNGSPMQEMQEGRQSALPNRNTGPTTIPHTSSNIPFKEQQLKRLRAHCLEFVAFRDSLQPRKVHLETALGREPPAERDSAGKRGSESRVADGLGTENGNSRDNSDVFGRQSDISRLPSTSAGSIAEVDSFLKEPENAAKKIKLAEQDKSTMEVGNIQQASVMQGTCSEMRSQETASLVPSGPHQSYFQGDMRRTAPDIHRTDTENLNRDSSWGGLGPTALGGNRQHLNQETKESLAPSKSHHMTIDGYNSNIPRIDQTPGTVKSHKVTGDAEILCAGRLESSGIETKKVGIQETTVADTERTKGTGDLDDKTGSSQHDDVLSTSHSMVGLMCEKTPTADLTAGSHSESPISNVVVEPTQETTVANTVMFIDTCNTEPDDDSANAEGAKHTLQVVCSSEEQSAVFEHVGTQTKPIAFCGPMLNESPQTAGLEDNCSVLKHGGPAALSELLVLPPNLIGGTSAIQVELEATNPDQYCTAEDGSASSEIDMELEPNKESTIPMKEDIAEANDTESYAFGEASLEMHSSEINAVGNLSTRTPALPDGTEEANLALPSGVAPANDEHMRDVVVRSSEQQTRMVSAAEIDTLCVRETAIVYDCRTRGTSGLNDIITQAPGLPGSSVLGVEAHGSRGNELNSSEQWTKVDSAVDIETTDMKETALADYEETGECSGISMLPQVRRKTDQNAQNRIPSSIYVQQCSGHMGREEYGPWA